MARRETASTNAAGSLGRDGQAGRGAEAERVELESFESLADVDTRPLFVLLVCVR